MVTFALGLSMKNAGMRFEYLLVSQKCREGWRYVGDGGWNRRELIKSPIIDIGYCIVSDLII